MNKGQALLTLLEKLQMVGIDPERIDVKEVKEKGGIEVDDIEVQIGQFKHSRIVVSVSDYYWRYPGVACYFVNWNADAGNFTACAGTPFVERALFEIGEVWEKANRIELETLEAA